MGGSAAAATPLFPVFWANLPCGSGNDGVDGSVWRAEKDGAAAAVLGGGCMLGLTASAAHVAWAAFGEVRVAAIDGGERGIVGTAGQTAYHVAIDEPFVYWGSAYGTAIKRSRIGDPACNGDECIVFRAPSALSTVAIDRGTIYWGEWGENAATRAANLDGTAMRVLEPGEGARSFTFGPDRAYWLAGGQIHTEPRGGGGARVLVEDDARAVVFAGGRLYWATGSGEIHSSDASGQDLRTVAKGIGSATSIASDGVALYWTSQGDGTVGRFALP